MDKILYSLCVLIFCSSATHAQKKGDIQGEVKSASKIKKISLNYRIGDESITDSAEVKGERFHFTYTVSEPTFAMIRLIYAPKEGSERPGYEARQIFLEPGISNKIVINDSLKNAMVNGGAAMSDFKQLQSMLDPIEKQRREFNEKYREYSKNKDTAGMQKIRALMEKADGNSIEDVYHRFLKNKPKSPIGIYVLDRFSGYAIDPAIAEPLFNKLSAANQKSESGRAFKERIETAKKTTVGVMAMNFTQNDTLGKPVSLTDFRGKYVLIDFWASWCGPCRAENPNVVKAFNEYKDKGFTVLGISLDQPGKHQAWMDAIHKDNLTWTQLSDLKGWRNEVSTMYGISAIPQNLLLDPTGKIIAKNIRGEELPKTLKSMIK
ncbi:MAG: TlpA disulfide reductase family protein [Ginsengibacter sp.]